MELSYWPDVIITATPPTPNGPLHLGHLSGPYLGADIAARAVRSSGRTAALVTGLDPNQNYVVTAAEKNGLNPDEWERACTARIETAWAQARIGFDVIAHPREDSGYREGVLALFQELLAAPYVEVKRVAALTCEHCGRFAHHAYVSGRCSTCDNPSTAGTCEVCGELIQATDMVDVVSSCGSPLTPFELTAPVLVLEGYRSELERFWTRALLPARVRALVSQYLSRPLPEILLSYPTDWGYEVGSGLRLDVWVEMGLGSVVNVGRLCGASEMTSSNLVAHWPADSDLWNFLGFDNSFYNAVLFPAIYVALGINPDCIKGLVVNEFLELDNRKFSTSRAHAIWADDFLKDADIDLARTYLSLIRPDVEQTSFSTADYLSFIEFWGPVLRATESSVPTAGVVKEHSLLQPAHFDPSRAALAVMSGILSPEEHNLSLQIIQGKQ